MDFDIVKPYKAIKDELTVTSKGIILRGPRIGFPQSLQQRAVDIAHESHLGLTKTKTLLREKILFPSIDELVKSTLEECLPCQAVGHDQNAQGTLRNSPSRLLRTVAFRRIPACRD